MPVTIGSSTVTIDSSLGHSEGRVMRRASLSMVVAASLVTATAMSLWSPAPARATHTTPTGVVVSGQIWPRVSNPLVDDLHHRVFIAGSDRLVSFSLALSDRRSLSLGPGDVRIFMPPNDSALFVVKRTISGWHLTRIDPATLTRTGTWDEPRAETFSNLIAWSRGQFWAVVQRPSTDGHTRYVLATLDPNHPGLGWRTRVSTDCWLDEYVVSSAQRHWLACVVPASTAHVYLYRIGAEAVPELVSSSDVPNFIDGPSFSPDGTTAILDAPSQDPITGYAEDGFFMSELPDIATPVKHWITSENYNMAAMTPDGRWIAAFRNGYSDFYDPSEPTAPPVHGAYIPPTDGVDPLVPPYTPGFSATRPFAFILVDMYSGGTRTYHLARYREPTP